ncbi:MAG: DUF2914 domain-containing protein [Desulfatitalea sp.]|nr:DUF2914 domain-containing protein [Desulfatitalea sp.]NNK01479.1 DUF2914 domain-containing protein [Desulfatitalea sp.]
MRNRRTICVAILVWLWVAPIGHAADSGPASPEKLFRLTRAVMCETIEGYEPNFEAVAFSINAGRISCYTAFEEVMATTFVSHKWYRHDELVSAKRLTIKSPKWATYSSIQLREADKGPWRVEIWDARNRIIKVLRFSVTD